MKIASELHIVQFSFWNYQSFNLQAGVNGVSGANGAGKTSLLDAIQIVMLGAHGNHTRFNAQSVQPDQRTIRDYCLGTLRSEDEGNEAAVSRARDEALTYLTIVWQGEKPEDVISTGVCLHSTLRDKNHRLLGCYIAPGVHLSLEDHLQNVDDDSKIPLDFAVFEAQLRHKGQQAGRKPTITSKPETFQEELMHALQQPGRMIDQRRFVRAFSHSLNLKHVENVSDFLRGYLVEPQPIERQGTLRHIKTMRRMQEMIAETRAELVTLELMDKQMNKLLNEHRRSVTAQAVRVLIHRNDAEQKQTDSFDEMEIVEGQIKELDSKIETFETTIKHFEERFEDLQREYARDPEAQNPEQLRMIRQGLQREMKDAQDAVHGMHLTMREALDRLGLALNSSRIGGDHEARVRAVSASIQTTVSGGAVPTVDDYERGFAALKQYEREVNDMSRKALLAETEAERQVESVKYKMRAAESGHRVMDNDVAQAMEQFERAGIPCQTVASLVRVTESGWQGPIETYLGKARAAIVVQEGREREAVAIVRKHQIPEVTVVQPNHLRDQLNRRPDPMSVAALLEGDNEVALTYLRRRVSSMRQVETEEDLERYDHAMTMDYMISQGGGTRRMRPLHERAWALGMSTSSADLQTMRNELAEAQRQLSAAQGQAEHVRQAQTRMTEILRDRMPHQYAAALQKFELRKTAVDQAKDETTDLSEPLKEKQAQINAARKLLEAERQAHGSAKTQRSDLHRKCEELAKAGDQHKQNFLRYRSTYDEMRGTIDFVIEDVEASYEAELKRGNIFMTLDELQARITQAAERIQKLTPDVVSDFRAFISERSIDAQEERQDWRKAHVWVTARTERLKTSTLIEYEEEARQARISAETAFQSDVKYGLNERFVHMTNAISEINKMLSSCPPFSNGERYSFVATINPTHAKLHAFITRTDLENAAPTLDGDNAALVDLLEACESGADKGSNPLEDYRKFFDFDLNIMVNGKKVDTLSKRTGKASNGEHRVPYYVIAGAALANAYRIKDPGNHNGVGVMLMDEAFYGIDDANTFAVTQFLRSLGLQLILAYPPDSYTKIAPVLDESIEISRWGTEAFAEQVSIKEPARQLFQSDIPEMHPELVDETERQLTLV